MTIKLVDGTGYPIFQTHGSVSRGLLTSATRLCAQKTQKTKGSSQNGLPPGTCHSLSSSKVGWKGKNRRNPDRQVCTHYIQGSIFLPWLYIYILRIRLHVIVVLFPRLAPSTPDTKAVEWLGNCGYDLLLMGWSNPVPLVKSVPGGTTFPGIQGWMLRSCRNSDQRYRSWGPHGEMVQFMYA